MHISREDGSRKWNRNIFYMQVYRASYSNTHTHSHPVHTGNNVMSLLVYFLDETGNV